MSGRKYLDIDDRLNPVKYVVVVYLSRDHFFTDMVNVLVYSFMCYGCSARVSISRYDQYGELEHTYRERWSQ